MFKVTAMVDRLAVRKLVGARKLLVLSGVILGLVAPSAASAVIGSVFEKVTCTTQGPGATEGQRWCGNTGGTTVPSWDGTPIDVAVAFPPAKGADNKYPVVGLYHGWGGSKITPSSSSAQRWLKLGYATFSITDRGWGSSCGGPSKPANTVKAAPCEKGYIHLMSRAYEVRDVQTLLGELADEGVINPQRIGANGGSYGGGMSLQLGALKDRVELPNHELIPWESPFGQPMKIAATAAEFPWTDIATALQPNGSTLDYVANSPYAGMLGDHRFGIEKNNWSAALYGAGAAIGYYGPESDPEANLTGWHNFNITGGPYDGKPLAIQQEEQLPYHSPYYLNLSEPPAPTIMENGWNDDLFPVDETVKYYNKVRSSYPNQQMQLFYWDLGHNPRSATTLSTSDGAKYVAAQNAWFAYFVKGEGSEPAEARGGVRAITSFCPQTAGGAGVEFDAKNWASLAPGEIRFNGAEEQTIQAPGTAPTTAFTTGTICTTQAAGENASAATYKLPAAPASGFTIAGSSTVIAEFSTPEPNDQIVARLYDVNVPGGGTQQLIGRQMYRPLNPGEGFTKQIFQMHPQAWNVAAGHVVKLELLVQDSTYARTSSSPHSIQVKNLELRVPTADPPGSAEGTVLAPAPKYLPPGYTFALNETPPTVVTGAASSVTQTSATLNATVNPQSGTVSDCHFEYGPTESYGTSVPCSSLPGSGESPVAVSASIGSLTPKTGYHFRIVATNSGGTSFGSDQTFTTPPNAPAVVTEPASSIGQTSAILNATVNPEGGTVSNCHFEYGTTLSYGTSVPCSSLPGSGESPVAVSASLVPGTLSENTTYHFRIVATNPGGTSFGSDQAFTTLPNAPAVVTGMASSVTSSSATLNATVDPEGGTVSDCHFEYGTTMSYGTSMPCSSLPGSGESPVAVSASIGGLSAKTIYHFRIVATNPGGTSFGGDQTFTTQPAPATPHWFRDGAKVKQGESVPTMSWGTLALKTTVGGGDEITCHTVGGGSINNPVGGGAGTDSVQAFEAWNCDANFVCPAGTQPGIEAQKLPWSTTLQEVAGKIRDKITGMKVIVGCESPPEDHVVGVPFTVGEQEYSPLAPAGLQKGSSALHPGYFAFDAGSGSLEEEGSSGSVLAQTEGVLKLLGYTEQELVYAQ